MFSQIMPTDATTPVGETKVATPVLPASERGPQTYEDCIVVLDSLANEKDFNNIGVGLKRLRQFFSDRIGKKKADSDRDGGAAVKRALQNRSFKPYEPKPIQNEVIRADGWRP